MKRKSVVLKPIASFDEITEIGLNMPGCKMLLHYVDSSGKSREVSLDGVKKIRIETEDKGRVKVEKRYVKTKRGKIDIKGKI